VFIALLRICLLIFELRLPSPIFDLAFLILYNFQFPLPVHSARVVDGFETLERAFKERIVEDGEFKAYLEDPIFLVKAEIVGWNPDSNSVGSGGEGEGSAEADPATAGEAKKEGEQQQDASVAADGSAASAAEGDAKADGEGKKPEEKKPWHKERGDRRHKRHHTKHFDRQVEP